MLVALRAKNFILIDELELSLGPGLNVLTGETGAGKSILVGALDLLLGGRASPAAVRPGAREAEVEALFDTEGSPTIAARLEASGIPHDGELVIRRVIGATRSRAYLNGHMSGTGELAALAPELADVASQHESVALTDPQTHLAVLDRFGRLEADRLALSAEVDELVSLVRAIEAARVAHAERREREAFLSFQLHAIEAVDPKPGELEALHDERARLRNVERLGSATRRAAERLDVAEDALTDELARLARELGHAAELDKTLAEPVQRLDAAAAELREVGRELGRYAERLEADPARLAEVEERLFKLEQLLRQHGPTLDDVLATRARLEAERELLETSDERRASLAAELASKLELAAERARALRAARRAAAAKLGAAISRELGELGMGGARIEVDVAPLGGDGGELVVDGARLGRDGIDRVELLISPNKGIEPRPLRRIASGGELSRALLAVKRVLSEHGPAGLYVFDEVDTGVGGAVAEKIGRAIADVARHHQVLCITHQAPIAAYAEHHFVVSKDSEGELTTSRVLEVRGDERVREVARMLSGEKITEAALLAARELTREAERYKAARPALAGEKSRAARAREGDAAPQVVAAPQRPPATEPSSTESPSVEPAQTRRGAARPAAPASGAKKRR